MSLAMAMKSFTFLSYTKIQFATKTEVVRHWGCKAVFIKNTFNIFRKTNLFFMSEVYPGRSGQIELFHESGGREEMEFTAACSRTNWDRFYLRTIALFLSQHSQGPCMCLPKLLFLLWFVLCTLCFIFCFAHNPNKLMFSALPPMHLLLPKFMLKRPY